MSPTEDDLAADIEQTRQDGHALEETVKVESRSLGLAARKLHTAIARANEYQSAEITKNRGILEELDIRASYYKKLRADIDAVIAENSRQRRIVSAALRGAIAGAAAVESDLTRGDE